MSLPDSNSLCRECGLCCNGVIFADGQLRPGDDAARLRELGLAFVRPARAGGEKFRQPCKAFAGCQCQIYTERPKSCREFDCLLLTNVKAGNTREEDALRTVRSALRRVREVKRLMLVLGEADETVSLGKRFRRLQRKLENDPSDPDAAGIFGDLTLAVHDLNMLIREKFYSPS